VQLRSLALSVVAILALGATPATATPATTPAAWTVTLRDSCLTLCAARTYTVDANGNATYSYGTNAAPTGEQRVVTLDPAVTAAIARAVANAHADAWVQAYIRQPDAYGAFATREVISGCGTLVEITSGPTQSGVGSTVSLTLIPQ